MRIEQAFLTLTLLAFSTSTHAKRQYRPMGYYVREASLITIADTRRKEKAFGIVLSIHEIIKDDSKTVGTEILLEWGGERPIKSSADAYLPVPATNVLLLLRKEWQKEFQEQKKWPILESYTKPDEIAVARTLAGIYGLPDERDQLLALQKKALAEHSLYVEQLLADVRDMRCPDNLDVMTNLCDAISPADQVKLMRIIGGTGDLRVVSALLNAMQSSDEKVSIAAARELSWRFPGAPGVTEAFEKALKQDHLMREAARYLSKRRDVPEWNELRRKSESDWHRANKAWNAGDMKAAKAAYLEIIENKKNDRYVRISSTNKLLPNASATEKERIRKALLPQLFTDARDGNYLHADDAARILRELHHPDCLEALIEIVLRGDTLYRTAGKTAALAIRELGPEARKKCISHFVDNPGVEALNDYYSITIYLMKLIWLGDRDNFARIEKVLPVSCKSTWEMLSPLRVIIANEKDITSGLIHLLAESEDMPETAGDWIIFYLGDQKEKQAVNVLAEILIHYRNHTLTRAARDALISIGGVEVENKMLKLMTYKEERNSVRRAAIEVLFGLQGARSCELSRRMLREDDFGLKSKAIFHLGYHGTVDDLALLLPYCDYWKADRSTQGTAMLAVAGLRERHDYDINGPIVKNSATQ